MNIDKILNFFYEKTSQRIKTKIEESGVKQKDIYPDDPKIISSVVNNRRTKNNRFLIRDGIVATISKKDGAEYGFLPKLSFESRQEILWGSNEEINSYIYDLFVLLWEEVSSETSSYGIDKDLLLCDYIPYAKYKSYWNIIFSSENKYSAIAYGIYEDDVVGKIGCAEKKALMFLYQKCQQEFLSNFEEFAKNTLTFYKINQAFKKDFIEESFVPLLKKHTPDSSSLGLRVRDLIYSDLSHCAPLVHEEETEDCSYLKKLISATSSYVLALENIQKDMLISMQNGSH